MNTTSPRNCTIAQPWTPYSWWRRFLSDRSKYQLWSWMGSWSTGFSWPCSSATWKVTRQQVLGYTSLTGQSRCIWYSVCTRAGQSESDSHHAFRCKSYTMKGLDSYSALSSPRLQHFSVPLVSQTHCKCRYRKCNETKFTARRNRKVFAVGTTVIYGIHTLTLL